MSVALKSDILNWKEDPFCATLQNHFTKRIWPPYGVEVYRLADQFTVVVWHGDRVRGPAYLFTFRDEIDEIRLGCTAEIDRDFDDAFNSVRLQAEGFLMTATDRGLLGEQA